MSCDALLLSFGAPMTSFDTPRALMTPIVACTDARRLVPPLRPTHKFTTLSVAWCPWGTVWHLLGVARRRLGVINRYQRYQQLPR